MNTHIRYWQQLLKVPTGDTFDPEKSEMRRRQCPNDPTKDYEATQGYARRRCCAHASAPLRLNDRTTRQRYMSIGITKQVASYKRSYRHQWQRRH
jgi:hypothetical protein